MAGRSSALLVAGALALVFATAPLGTTPLEIATLLAAGALMLRSERRVQPLLAPALAFCACVVLASAVDGAGAAWRSGLVAWAWALALIVPGARAAVPSAWVARLEAVGFGAAGLASAWALAEVGLAGVPPWVRPADGPFSHHLTLGYGLLPPLMAALERRRWGVAVGLALGVMAAGSSGPLLALVVGGAAFVAPASVALGGGVGVAMGAVVLLAGDAELWERAVLWTAGAEVGLAEPGGLGVARVREATAAAQHALVPGFHFPAHAHDSALQAAALAGFGAWVALAWLLVSMWRSTSRGGRAAIAALAVGGLTQDTFGDLEVVRALCLWALWSAGEGPAEPPRPADVQPDTSLAEPHP